MNTSLSTTQSNDQARPLSPSTDSSTNQASSSFAFSSPRIARCCHVEAGARPGGLRATVYLRLALPVVSGQTLSTFPLLTLNSHSHLLDHTFYRLPLLTSLSSTDPEALVAARHLDIALPFSTGGRVAASRAVGRSAGVFGTETDESASATAKLVQDDKAIFVALNITEEEGRNDRASPSVEEMLRPKSRPVSPVTPHSRSRGNSGSGRDGLSSGQKESWKEKLEWILVLRIDVGHGGLASSSFANTIFLPLPPCLRNHLAFTMPPPPSSDRSWDLSAAPSFRPHPSSPTTDSTGKDVIAGTFPSTDCLILRWAPHVPSSSNTSTPPLRLKTSTLQSTWSISDLGWGTVVVHCSGVVAKFISVNDKAYLDIRVAAGDNAGRELAQRAFEVISVDDSDEHGDLAGPVLMNWEVLRPGVVHSDDTTSHDLQDMISGPSTPTPRPRLANATPNQPRPPSFTSLFDAPPPPPVKIDSKTRERMRSPSLMLQKAPFGKGGPNEVGEMSFEISEEDGVEQPVGTERDFDTDDHSTIIRLFLRLSNVLLPAKMPTPSFSFRITASFPSITLRTLSSAIAPPSASPPSTLSRAPFRVALPSFSVPSSDVEDSVVSVSAGPGGSVELLTPLATGVPGTAMDSPLPAISGKARWKTTRTRDGRNHQTRPRIDDIFEIEVSIKGESRPTSLLVLDSHPDKFQTIRSEQVHSISSARGRLMGYSSHPPTSSQDAISAPSISTLQVRITSVAPPHSSGLWRIFTHITFPHGFASQFELSNPNEKAIELCGAWDVRGKEMSGEVIWDDEDSKVVRVGGVEGAFVRELLFATKSEAKRGTVEIGDVLPRFNAKVAEMAIDVLPVDGYQIDTSCHTFDTCTPPSHGTATRFTKFLLPPTTTSHLEIHLRPGTSVDQEMITPTRNYGVALLLSLFVFAGIALTHSLIGHDPPQFFGQEIASSGQQSVSIVTPGEGWAPLESSLDIIMTSSTSNAASPTASLVLEELEWDGDEDEEEEDEGVRFGVGWSVMSFPLSVGQWTFSFVQLIWNFFVGY